MSARVALVPRPASTPPRPPTSPPCHCPRRTDAPMVRNVTGGQLCVSGVVRAADTGRGIDGARILRWHPGPSGIYEDRYRALMITDASGHYQLQTVVPGIDGTLRRHIHFHVSAPGFRELDTLIAWADASLPRALNAYDFVLERL
jgi:protocatechuate 3,4-dioxygenase beta subunit